MDSCLQVLGANIVKSASRTFAVYSISVADVNNNSWSIKRRYYIFICQLLVTHFVDLSLLNYMAYATEFYCLQVSTF